ncbi:MAG: glutathionylspermidine synthase family protein [Dermatophilaceae bacterium]|nr:glutathionylspermidine synthase family protein [Dermatophilaceae bacterium]
MDRVPSAPRDGWLRTVEEQGLTYALDRAADGGTVPYWDESACYELTEADVEVLERATGELHRMTVAAVHRMAHDPGIVARHGLPDGAGAWLAASLSDPDATSVYGRLDLAWDGDGAPKLLEYNADTPAGLVEAAVCQWFWLEDLHPARDQWNLLHERLVEGWRRMRARTGVDVVHFAVGQDEPTEDWATVAYLRDTAQEAGLVALGITMEDIGWHHGQRRFVDVHGAPITHCFKMYPTEWMLDSPFGGYLLGGASTTQWVEPPWKLLAGSKALLPVLWEMFPGHPNLLPAYFDHPHGMTAYASKPLFGWEGDGVDVVGPDGTERSPRLRTDGQQRVYQQYAPLPEFDGNRPVLGTWVVDGKPAGLGIRESTNLVTNTGARFVPHRMLAPRSSPEQVAVWVAEP